MTSYLVSGAGTAACNGTYTENGTYNGYPAYTNGTYWIWVYQPWTNVYVWNLSNALGPAQNSQIFYGTSNYNGAPPNPDLATWQTVMGAAPIPTVTASITYRVTGAGIESYNGVYTESGSYTGIPTYTNGTYWLWGTMMPNMTWILNGQVGLSSPAYWLESATPVGTYVLAGGTEPAPTVAVDTGNQPPTCAIDVSLPVGAEVTVTPTASDTDGTVADITLHWSDGVTVPGCVSGQAYTRTLKPGSYGVQAVATDNLGATGESALVTVVVNAPPTCDFTVVQSGSVITVNAGKSSDVDGTIVAWRMQPKEGAAWVSGTVGQPLVYDYRFFTGEALLTVEVTDDDGATAQVSQLLDIGFPPRHRRLPRLAGVRRLIDGATETTTVPLPYPAGTRLLILHQIVGATTGGCLDLVGKLTTALTEGTPTTSYTAVTTLTDEPLALRCTVTDGTHSVWVRELGG